MVLCPVIRKLLHKRVVLASASPRRQEILRQAVSIRGTRRGPELRPRPREGEALVSGGLVSRGPSDQGP